MADRPAIMLAIMEPPPGLEEEFNDWYDTEHLPQRARLPGFLSASRWVCTRGFPRSLAVYDLDGLSALTSPDYLAVAGLNSTPWSRRILARTARAGRMRVEATRIGPGASLTLSAVNCLLVARFRTVDPSFVAEAALKFEALSRLAQARLFTTSDGLHTLALAEFGGPVDASTLTTAVGDIAGTGATIFNLYTPYSFKAT